MPIFKGFKYVNDRYAGINIERMRAYRVQRAVDQMKKYGLGSLITWDRYNIRYLSSVYVTIPTTWIESGACILFEDGEYYVLDSHAGDWDIMAEDKPWLVGRGISPRFSPTKMAENLSDCDFLVETMGKLMAEHGVTGKPVGLDGCTKQFLIGEALGNAGIKAVDAKNTLNWARAVKNQDEIECIRIAAANAEAAFADIRDAIRPGIRECDIVGIGQKRLYMEGSDETQEFVCSSGDRTNYNGNQHADFTDRMIRAGDLIIVDINGNCWLGYKTCYYRTFCCGKPTQYQAQIYDLANHFMEDGLSRIKAGVTQLEVAQGWPKGTQSYHGYTPKDFKLDNWEQVGQMWDGHGVGQVLQELPRLYSHRRNKSPDAPGYKLEQGMTIAVQTGCMLPGHWQGVRIEDDIAVTKDGYDNLTKWPRDTLTECFL